MQNETERRILGEFERMRNEMDRLLDSLMPGQWLPARHHCVWCPPTDVYETEDAAVVKVEIAGVDEEDFRISFANGVLTIAGVRRDKSESRQRAYQQMEIWSGPFKTQAHVPWPVDEDLIEARYADGFLTVWLPKAGRRTKRMPIRTPEER